MKTHTIKENSKISAFLAQFKTYWYLFVTGLIIFIALGYVYNHYATQQYLVSSSILLQQEPGNRDISSAYANGGVSPASVDEVIKNEGDVLRSRNLMKEVVEKMHLNVMVFANSGFFASEIYNEAPFEVNVIHNKVDSLKKQEYVINKINGQTFHLVNSDENVNKVYKFGEVISLPQYDITIEKRPNVPV